MSSPLRACFVPWWPKNPYHQQLARHLAAHQVEVPDTSRLKDIVDRARASGEWPEIVHLHALPSFRFDATSLRRFVMFWRRIRVLRHAGVRIVWTVHNVVDHEATWPAIDRAVCRRFFRQADAVILHSTAACRLVEQQWRVRSGANVSVVHHGHFMDCYPAEKTRETARVQLALRSDELVFLFLGSIRPYKGVVSLIHDFKAVASTRHRLIIAGEPLNTALRTEVEQAIDRDPRITFHPHFVADAAIQTYLHAADAVVFPYTRTLTSGALILAMSFGRACIAPRMGALADTLDAAGGFLYDPAAPGALRRALAQASREVARLPSMGRHNRARAAGWGWDEAARLTNTIYRSCLERNPKPSMRSVVFRHRPA